MISSEMIDIIGPAIAAGLLITLIHAPLGIEVLKRGIIFIDLAVAQIAGLGLVATSVYFYKSSDWLSQIVPLTCAILGALFFRMIENKIPKQQEAIIGVGFVLSASLAILVLADHPTGGEEIRHLLSGNMLFVTWQDILYHLPIYILIFFLWFALKLRKGISFYLIFALAITSSVQLVGIYVVFASLILPALAALNYKSPYRLAWLCGIISVVTGIILSIIFDAPAGPILVVSYVMITILIFTIKRIRTLQ